MNLLKEKYLWFYLLICPIVYIYGTNLPSRQVQEIFFQFTAMGLVILFTRNIWMIAFFFLNIFLAAQNNFSVGNKYIFNIFIGLSIFIVLRDYFSKNSFFKDARILLIVAALSAGWMVMQHYGVDPIYMVQNNAGVPQLDKDLTDMIGLFGIKAHNGIFMAIVTPIAYFLSPLLVLPIGYLVYLSESSAAVLSFGMVFLWLLFYTNRLLFWILVPILAFGIIFYMSHKDYKNAPEIFKSRFPMWHAVTKFFFQKPLGYGPESFNAVTKNKPFIFMSQDNYDLYLGFLVGKDATGKQTFVTTKYSPSVAEQVKNQGSPIMVTFDPKTKIRWDNAHSLYMQMAFEYGIIGIGIFIGFVTDLIRRFRGAVKTRDLIIVSGVLMVFFISSLTQFPLFVGRLACIFPVALAAFYALTDKEPEYGTI